MSDGAVFEENDSEELRPNRLTRIIHCELVTFIGLCFQLNAGHNLVIIILMLRRITRALQPLPGHYNYCTESLLKQPKKYTDKVKKK